jgi:hypothetical protein
MDGNPNADKPVVHHAATNRATADVGDVLAATH